MTQIPVNGRYNDTRDDFVRLSRLVQSALDASDDVIFDLRRCTWLSTMAVVLLGGAARAVQVEGRQATFEWPQSRAPPPLAREHWGGSFGPLRQGARCSPARERGPRAVPMARAGARQGSARSDSIQRCICAWSASPATYSPPRCT